jgi:glucosamine--fructose-6-phosphate aminotransferase (isomerizing)
LPKTRTVSFYNVDQEPVEKQVTHIKWDAQAADKGGFEHFMMKEIHEQPKAVKETLNSAIRNRAIDFSPIGLSDDTLKQFASIDIIACGSLIMRTGGAIRY